MIGLPIEWIVLLILAMSGVLFVLLCYLAIVKYFESKRQKLSGDYLSRNKERWYEYLRKDDICDEQLIPNNMAEITAIEELFRSVANNLKGKDLERRISQFSNKRLGGFYQQTLKSRNWGKRINALHRIYDFNIHSLEKACRGRITDKVSNDELFLLLAIELKFAPEKFLSNYQHRLQRLSINDLKELLYSMPDEVFNETVTLKDRLQPNVLYALVDVVGMKMDTLHTHILEELYRSLDDELRIRVIRAYNTLAVVPESKILAKAVVSKQWQERYQVAQMFKLMSETQAAPYIQQLVNDDVFLVRDKAQRYFDNRLYVDRESVDMYTQVAASLVDNRIVENSLSKEWVNASSDERGSLERKGEDEV